MYLAAAVAGNVASFYGSAAPSLGASGAIFGIGGALAMYFYRNKWDAQLHGRGRGLAGLRAGTRAAHARRPTAQPGRAQRGGVYAPSRCACTVGSPLL